MPNMHDDDLCTVRFALSVQCPLGLDWILLHVVCASYYICSVWVGCLLLSVRHYELPFSCAMLCGSHMHGTRHSVLSVC
jgi:hypothetical protein